MGSTSTLPQKERNELDRLAARGALRVAAVSLWETQMLHAKARLTLKQPFDIWIRDAAAVNVAQVLPLGVEVVIALGGLPVSFHGDPADRLIVSSSHRLIVSTSRAHKIPLATHDAAIRKSRVTALWKPG